MKFVINYILCVSLVSLMLKGSCFIAFSQVSASSANECNIKLKAAVAKVNNETTEIVLKKDFRENQWITLKDNVEDRIDDDTEDDPDIVFYISPKTKGTYVINTYVQRQEEIKKGVKVKTLFAKVQIGNQRVTRRIISDAHDYTSHSLGRFQLSGVEELKIWLPKGILFGAVDLKKHMPVQIPPILVNYKPKILPPASRPRLWMNRESLPLIQQRLTKGENLRVWSKVRDEALKPFLFTFSPKKEIYSNVLLENTVQIKAFYYLMTRNHQVGNEAVKLMLDYLSVLEFGNVKSGDITRDIGRAIYTAALVYDWCHAIINDQERETLYSEMMRLAEDMEIGWPPFKDTVVNGHASEAQVNRDLLAMSIAVYDEDPEPYRYTSYLILEKLVPMRAFEYQSPRHSQGLDYGAYRHGWEMHAAWLFYRMSGTRVFDKNIEELTKYWLYMRLPDGSMLRDGDVFSNRDPYWKMPETMLLDYAYGDNPMIKAEFERQGGELDNSLLYLLLNDPDLKAQHCMDYLPLSVDYGSVLGGMVARTGWNMGDNSNDVITEIKGGGYHFGNHQHSDAGAIQLYYRGLQVCDLGLYFSYGIPYDFNFNKRSVAHSMMLVKDTKEELLFRSKINDGGTKFNQRTPETPEEVKSDPWFDNGTVLSTTYEESKQKPLYSYFKVDLTGAYTNKVSNYIRKFCFLNLDNKDIPAAIILSDDMCISKEDFQTFWKINTLKEPFRSDSSIVLWNSKNGQVGKTHINMLLPLSEDRELEMSNIRDSNSVLGYQYKISSNLPEANGYQIVAYLKKKQKYHRFLTVFQMASGETKPFPVKFYENDNKYIISLSDRIICMSSGSRLIQNPFFIDVVENTVCQLLITDLKSGFWNVSSSDNKVNMNIKVEPKKNIISFQAAKGRYFISPGRLYDDIE